MHVSGVDSESVRFDLHQHADRHRQLRNVRQSLPRCQCVQRWQLHLCAGRRDVPVGLRRSLEGPGQLRYLRFALSSRRNVQFARVRLPGLRALGVQWYVREPYERHPQLRCVRPRVRRRRHLRERWIAGRDGVRMWARVRDVPDWLLEPDDRSAALRRLWSGECLRGRPFVRRWRVHLRRWLDHVHIGNIERVLERRDRPFALRQLRQQLRPRRRVHRERLFLCGDDVSIGRRR